MKSRIHLLVYICSFLLFSCVPLKPSKPIHFAEQTIHLSGFSIKQEAQILSTIEKLKSLKAGSLKIKRGIYRRLSRFERLFGFPFDGQGLSVWVLNRLPEISYQNTWTVAVNQNRGTLFIGDQFFEDLSDLERLYILIHEARHSDDDGYEHVKCPKGFHFVSAAQPDIDLQGEAACDADDAGAYAFQAAFLYELFAYGIFDQREVGLLYNSSISRVLK